MKKEITTSIKHLRADKPLLFMVIGVATAALIYSIFVGLSLSPTDSQIATRYTAFGITHFYRDQWFYLGTFVGFGSVIGVVHGAIIAKLQQMNMRSLAMAFGWLSLGMLVIIAAITHAILRDIAYLS